MWVVYDNEWYICIALFHFFLSLHKKRLDIQTGDFFYVKTEINRINKLYRDKIISIQSSFHRNLSTIRISKSKFNIFFLFTFFEICPWYTISVFSAMKEFHQNYPSRLKKGLNLHRHCSCDPWLWSTHSHPNNFLCPLFLDKLEIDKFFINSHTKKCNAQYEGWPETERF